jgi:hypothetical protein
LLLSTTAKEFNEKKPQNIPALLKKIVGEIELVGWLNPDERERLVRSWRDMQPQNKGHRNLTLFQKVNTFISDLAYRYNQVQDIIIPQFNPAQNRILAIKTFEKIGQIKVGRSIVGIKIDQADLLHKHYRTSSWRNAARRRLV